MRPTSLDLDALTHPRRSVRGLMGEVMLALVPGTVLAASLIDLRILVNVGIAVIAAMAIEAAILLIRRRPVFDTVGDGSIALAGWLLALTVPPGLPYWQLIFGIIVMVSVGKQLYGGLGSNPFNPAMVGYAVLIVSFPLTMTTWPVSAAGEPTSLTEGRTSIVQTTDTADTTLSAGTVSTVGTTVDPEVWDAVTAPTPLDRLRTRDRERRSAETRGTRSGDAVATTSSLDEDRPDVDEVILSSPWPWVNAGYLVGGLWLLARGVIGWRIPVSLLGSLAILHGLHGVLSATAQPSVSVSLLAGAAMLGAFFIATDPVSAASGPRARLIYGASIGVMTFVFREFGGFPEGIAFAVLLANATVPMLDRLLGTPGNRP